MALLPNTVFFFLCSLSLHWMHKFCSHLTSSFIYIKRIRSAIKKRNFVQSYYRIVNFRVTGSKWRKNFKLDTQNQWRILVNCRCLVVRKYNIITSPNIGTTILRYFTNNNICCCCIMLQNISFIFLPILVVWQLTASQTGAFATDWNPSIWYMSKGMDEI
jgi:hypothetical protein